MNRVSFTPSTSNANPLLLLDDRPEKLHPFEILLDAQGETGR
jgi:hypothetical protein